MTKLQEIKRRIASRREEEISGAVALASPAPTFSARALLRALSMPAARKLAPARSKALPTEPAPVPRLIEVPSALLAPGESAVLPEVKPPLKVEERGWFQRLKDVVVAPATPTAPAAPPLPVPEVEAYEAVDEVPEGEEFESLDEGGEGGEADPFWDLLERMILEEAISEPSPWGSQEMSAIFDGGGVPDPWEQPYREEIFGDVVGARASRTRVRVKSTGAKLLRSPTWLLDNPYHVMVVYSSGRESGVSPKPGYLRIVGDGHVTWPGVFRSVHPAGFVAVYADHRLLPGRPVAVLFEPGDRPVRRVS